MNNNDYRREEFEKRRNYKGTISMCEGYTCPIFLNCLLEIKKLQQENKILKENAENNDKVVDKVNWEKQLLKKENKQLKERINKALNKIDNMFDRGDTNTIIDDLLELDKIFKGSDSSE